MKIYITSLFLSFNEPTNQPNEQPDSKTHICTKYNANDIDEQQKHCKKVFRPFRLNIKWFLFGPEVLTITHRERETHTQTYIIEWMDESSSIPCIIALNLRIEKCFYSFSTFLFFSIISSLMLCFIFRMNHAESCSTIFLLIYLHIRLGIMLLSLWHMQHVTSLSLSLCRPFKRFKIIFAGPI